MTSKRKFILFGLITILILTSIIILWLYTIKPKEPYYLLNPEKTIRTYIIQGDTKARIASAILMVTKGESEANEILIDEFLKLPDEQQHLVYYILINAGSKCSFTTYQVDRLINYNKNFRFLSLQLIPEGKEKEHLSHLRKIAQADYCEEYPTFYTFHYCIKKLIAAEDYSTLEYYHKKILEDYGTKKELPFFLAKALAAILVISNKDNSIKGFESIEKEIPESFASKIKKDYILEMCEREFFSSIIDIFLSPNLQENDKEMILTTLAQKKLKIPAQQENRLSQKESDRLLLEYAQFCEKNYIPVTREGFERLLKESNGAIMNSIAARISGGDKDLRELIIKKALTTKDSQQAYDLVYALEYWLGGIPKEVHNYIWNLAFTTSEPKDLHWNSRLISLLASSSQKSKTKKKYTSKTSTQVFRIPWCIRRNTINKAINDLKEIKTACDSYFIDWSNYPPQLKCLTTPVAFLRKIKKDICAPEGNYAYMASFYNYCIASTGPDGIHDVYLPHFHLHNIFMDKSKPEKKLSIYVVPTSTGYDFKDSYVSGSDIVFTKY